MEKNIILHAEHVKKWFPVNGWFFEEKKYTKAVDDVSLDVFEGETIGICGESGCGKSTLIRTLLCLIKPDAGSKVVYKGTDITTLKASKLRSFRKEMQIIFQDPYSSLDARMKIGSILQEPMIINGIYKNKEQRLEAVKKLMNQVGLPESYINRYPHEFSGGQRQRIVIARALATNPRLVMCDEAVSALDVSVRAQVLNLLKTLQKDLGLTYMFVSHDLSVIEYICDRIVVMYLGKIVEIGSKAEIFNNPKHPYTKALLSAVPVVGQTDRKDRIILKGDIPSPMNPPSGCRFRTRCLYATPLCAEKEPPVKDFGNGHLSYCHFSE